MQTGDLIKILTADTAPVSRWEARRRLAMASAAGGLVSVALVALWLGVRSDLGDAVQGGFFWAKAAYTAALCAVFCWATLDLGRPDAKDRRPWMLGVIIVGIVVALGLAQFAPLGAADKLAALRGVSWTVCVRNIVLLGAPLIALTLVVLRGLAPTRPRLAGLAAGLFAGSLAATIYGLHCPEATFVFVGAWYTLGIACCGCIGAVLGRLFLRW